MDNPNPIRYADLIQPDNSITTLIAQLDELIAKYDIARVKIQGAAADAAKSMQNLSGATDEQRQSIQLLTTQSEKLAKAYEETNVQERETYRRRQEVIQAVKEEQQIDKLLVQINNSVEGSYNRLSAQYRLNKIRLNEMSAEQRRTAGVGKELEAETRAIYEEMSRLQQATGKYTLEVGHYQNALQGLPGPINQVVRGFTNMRTNLSTISNSSLPIAQKALQGFTTVMSGTIGMIAIFVRYLTGSAKTMREFEQANADLSTILGVNVKDMGALTDSALALGRTTEYTASQVTALQTELAKLGFGQGSIINMQKYVLQFATAVGANLADAASVAGSALRAFNLSSTETEDVLATLAVATNNSALNFDRIQQSIGTVFPVANAFGLSLKDTTALLGSLANAGFDASSAATATRNIILKLADSNGKLAQRLGGSVKSFDEIMTALVKLRNEGINLNEALELTDRRSVAAFSAFLSGAESARELRNSLQDVSGELDRIQRERLNTVEGSTKLLKSAWEGLTLAFRESNGAIKDTIDWLTKLIGKVQALLFPTETATQQWTDQYTKAFQELAKSSSDDAIKYANETVEHLQQELADAEQTLANTPSIFAGRVAKAAKAAEDAQNRLNGALKAQSLLTQQVADGEAEKARIQQQVADEEAAKQEELTKEEKKRIEAAKKQRLADLRAVVEAINLEISTTEAGTEKMLQLRLDKIEAERRVELEQNRQKVASERQDEAAINAKFDKQLVDAEKQFNKEVAQLAVQRLQAEQQAIQLEIAITEDGTDRMLQLRLENIEKQRQIEIEQNKQKEEKLRQDETAIDAKYNTLRLREIADFNHKIAERDLAALQDLQQAEFDLLDRNERQKTIFRLEQEKKRLLALLELDKTASKKMTAQEIEAIKATIAAIEKETSRVGYNNLYELLGIGLDSQQQDALNTAIDSIKDSIGSLVDSWNAAADAALEAANKQVDAAQKVLDAEIEARNAGYANEVETAQKELELAKKTQADALKEKQRAQRAQLAADAITQSSSLVTATANIWSALSGIKVIGPALAIAAIATMWGSFAAAKIKAAQVAGQTEQYGQGTVELLQGGSHASGHDIDLGTKPDGTRRRAEGGEFFAVINKRNSRRYRNVIPDVIESFNNGTFADRYQRANAAMAGYAVGMVGGGSTDVSGLERDVAAIRKQGDESRYIDGQGNTVIKYKNLTRKIIKS
jgi:TP901 family phage tail tape measure protein